MLLPPPRGLNKVRLSSPLKILVLPVRFIAGHITDRLGFSYALRHVRIILRHEDTREASLI